MLDRPHDEVAIALNHTDSRIRALAKAFNDHPTAERFDAVYSAVRGYSPLQGKRTRAKEAAFGG